MSSLYIVIPAYNESENIEKTIDQWYPVVERHNDEGNSRHYYNRSYHIRNRIFPRRSHSL